MKHDQVEEADVGPLVTNTDLRSSFGAIKIFPRYKVEYPGVAIGALIQLYREYNRAFGSLVEANREWANDYHFCTSRSGIVNYLVQFDMLGLPLDGIDSIKSGTVEAAREFLRYRIFEIENSLATYQIYERVFAHASGHSLFSERYRIVLDSLRQRFDLPVALLAVTDEKYEALRATEYGKVAGERLSVAEIRELSGFDALLGPRDLEHGTIEGSLLYVRSSDPISRLKDPAHVILQPLLGDEATRQVIKAQTVTLNVDAPDMEFQHRINDTKEYLVAMRMGYLVSSREDFESPAFEQYLRSQELTLDDVIRRTVRLRAKPLKGAYGCYGHIRGFANSEFFRRLRRELDRRGPYVVQPEMIYPMISDRNGKLYTATDRLFFGIVGDDPVFLGGFRFLMPVDSLEARRGRSHGHADAIWAEIVARGHT